MKPSKSQVRVTMLAAKDAGIVLSDAEAEKHAERILHNMIAEENFWAEAKHYFLQRKEGQR